MSNAPSSPTPRTASSAAAALFALTSLTALAAQEPNVLPRAASYHLGYYSSSIEVPSGEQKLNAGTGSMTFAPDGTLVGALDKYETDLLTGTTAILGDPLAGTYTARGDGRCVIDTDPSAPGTDVTTLWITADGAVLHGVTSTATIDAGSVFAIEAGSGLSTATLSGTYRVVNQGLEFDASTSSGWRVTQEIGAVTFDGGGGGNINGIKFDYAGPGATTSPLVTPFTYSVAADGALAIGDMTGACSADGELLFLVTAKPTGEVGLLVGVRVAASYDLGDLVGRRSLTSHGYELGATSSSLPVNKTIFGDVELTATSASNGSWTLDAVAAATSPGGTSFGPRPGSGAATLTTSGPTAGELTLVEPGRSWTLWVSDSGRYAVGRVPGPNAEMLFGAKQCPAAAPIGVGTAGTGGASPRLGMRTYPRLGNGAFAFAVENALGGGICALPIATATIPGVPVFGGVFHLDPTTIGYVATVLLSGTAGAAGQGAGLAPLPLPNNVALLGAELAAQALVFDPAATAGIALSNAYRLFLCR